MVSGKVTITKAGTNSNYYRVSIPVAYLAPYGLEIGKRYQWLYTNGLLYLTPVNNQLGYSGVVLSKYTKQPPRISMPIPLVIALGINENEQYDIVPYAGFIGIRI